MRKPTKAEENAAAAVRAFAAGGPMTDAWEAVWAVVMDQGYWHRESGLVWFATLHVRHGGNEKRLVASGLSGEVTGEEVRHRFGLGPKPPAEEADAKEVAARKARVRANYLDGVAADLRRLAPRLTELVAELTARVQDTEPLPPA